MEGLLNSLDKLNDIASKNPALAKGALFALVVMPAFKLYIDGITKIINENSSEENNETVAIETVAVK